MYSFKTKLPFAQHEMNMLVSWYIDNILTDLYLCKLNMDYQIQFHAFGLSKVRFWIPGKNSTEELLIREIILSTLGSYVHAYNTWGSECMDLQKLASVGIDIQKSQGRTTVL